MTELRNRVRQTLLELGVLIDDTRFHQTLVDAAMSGRRNLSCSLHTVGAEPFAVARSFNLSLGAVSRIFGQGWQQSVGLAALAGVRANRIPAVAQLGALLTLGIVLFDQVADASTDRRELLFERVSPRLFDAPSGRALKPCGDPEIDFLAAFAHQISSRAVGLRGRQADYAKFIELLREMYLAERASLSSRVGSWPCQALWDSLRSKSALPSVAVATLGLMGNPCASDSGREACREAGVLIGEAFWIVDDLADIGSDWEAGCWSRPLLLLLDRLGDSPSSIENVVRHLLETGIAASEAMRLGQVLRELADLCGKSERTLVRPVQAAVRSWVEEIPY